MRSRCIAIAVWSPSRTKQCRQPAKFGKLFCGWHEIRPPARTVLVPRLIEAQVPA